MKELVLVEEGYAREDAIEGASIMEVGGGRGCWMEREGRDKLSKCKFGILMLRLNAGGRKRDGDWKLEWRQHLPEDLQRYRVGLFSITG